MCMICFTESLSPIPSLLLSCGHVFHLHCCRYSGKPLLLHTTNKLAAHAFINILHWLLQDGPDVPLERPQDHLRIHQLPNLQGKRRAAVTLSHAPYVCFSL